MNLITIASSIKGNKEYRYNSRAQNIESSSPTLHQANAITTKIETHGDLIKMLKRISKDETMFIILGYPQDVKIDQEYKLLSQSVMEKCGGNNIGWHKINQTWAICRNKNNFVQSNWIMFDYDIYDDTPKKFILDYKQWIKKMGIFENVELTFTNSNSSRIYHPEQDQNQTKYNHFHTFVQVKDSNDVERFGHAMFFKMLKDSKCYLHINKNGGSSWKTIFDKSVLSRERCIYKGKPIIHKPLKCTRSTYKNVNMGHGVLDTSIIKIKYGDKAKGIIYSSNNKLNSRSVGDKKQNGALICNGTLKIDTRIDTKDFGWMTIQEYSNSSHGHLRCQSPFRESTSWAAFLDRHKNGEVFLYDSGDEIKYMVDLSNNEQDNTIHNNDNGIGTIKINNEIKTGKYDLDFPPGLTGRLCSEINEMAHHPNQDISIISGIGIIAGICGRSFNVSGTGLNMYIALLAHSGIGKNTIKDSVTRVFRSDINKPVWATFMGMHRFTGPKAIFNMLQGGLSRICVLEESGLLSESNTGDQKGLLRAFLDLYTNSGDGQWAGGEGYSSDKQDIPLIPNPALSLIHVSTPQIFIKSLKSKKSAQSGELARMWSIRSIKPKAYLNPQPRKKYSKKIRNRLSQLMDEASRYQIPVTDNKPGEPIKINVPKFVINDNNKWVDRENNYMVNDDQFNATLCSRAWMKSVKIAAIISVFNHNSKRDNSGIVISEDAYTWSKNAVTKEITHLQDSFSYDSTDDMLQIVKTVIIPVIIKSYNGGFKDKRNNTSPILCKNKIFAFSTLNKVLQNNSIIKHLDDDPSNPNPKKGIEKIVDYMLRTSLIVRVDPLKLKILGHGKINPHNCYQITDDMLILME